MCYQQDILTTFDRIWFWNSSPVAQILCNISANQHGQGWHLYIPQISTTIAWMVVLWMVTGHLLPNSWSPFNAFSFSTYNTPEYFYGPLGTLPPSFVPTKIIILGQTMMFWCLNLSRVLCKKKIENWTWTRWCIFRDKDGSSVRRGKWGMWYLTWFSIGCCKNGSTVPSTTCIDSIAMSLDFKEKRPEKLQK